jgi:hypothetical protein
MRFNLSNITNKLNASVKTVESIQATLESKLDLLTKWDAAQGLTKAVREVFMHNLSQLIVTAYTENNFDFEANDPEGRTFSAFVVPFFENFPNQPESKVWKKWDDAKKRSFAKSWSEVIVVPARTGQTATQKRTANRKKQKESAKTRPATFEQVLASVPAFTAKENLALLKVINKQLGLGLTAQDMKIA